MKRKIKYVALTLICIVAIIGVSIITDHVNANSNELAVEGVSYSSQRSTHDVKEDGWVYVFEITYAENKQDPNLYIFDGYNLKYKELEGYYVPVIDKKTGEVLDRVNPSYITLSISETYKEDIYKIGDFFNEKQFIKKITIDDLKDLEIKKFEKSYLVELFNKAIDAELKTKTGDYMDNSFVDKVKVDSTDKTMNGEWQVAYLMDYGYISEVNIEFINENGSYLSDEVKNTRMISDKQELFESIQQIEKEIIEMQSFSPMANSSNSLERKSNNASNDLNRLFNELSKRMNEVNEQQNQQN